MTSRRAPPSTMRTRNTIRVSPASESSRPGASGQDNTPSSMYESTMVVSEKNTLFLPQELKLGGPSNWEQYSPAQKAILRINGLEDAVFGDYPPEEQQTIDQKIRAAKAAVSIRGNCTGEALSQLVGIENPQEMYNLLQAYCIGTGPVLLQTTLYQFIRIKTSSYETIPQFNVDFERLVKLLLEQKEPISDTLKKVVYLTACENEYPDWTARQRALLRSEHPPTLRSMQQDLIDENRSSDDDDSHGTASTYWAHSKKTGRKGPTARKQEASGRRRGSSKNRRATNKPSQEANHRIGKHKDHTCTNCKKRGHHENDCWFAHKDKRPDWAVRLAKELMEHDLQRDNTKNLHIKESNHMTVERSFLILEDSVSDELPMDNTEACKVSLDNISSPTAWLFDTGSSVHICNDQSLFTELQPATRTVLVTGGGKVYPSGRGTVKICFINKWGDQVPVNLKDTLFIPEFPVNVMSGLRLYKNGGWIDGNDMYDPTGDVFGLLRIGRDGLYVNTEVGKTTVSNQAVSELQPEPCNHHIASSNQCLNVDLWHRRLGHVNAYQVSQTAKMTRGMYCDGHHDHQPFNYCLACDIAKALRWTPRNKRKRASRAGFIHVDTFKVNPPGIRGERWGMIATDDRHRMRWAYTFTRKGMASELLGQLISKIRTQYGIRVYAIQMDGGSELYGASLKNLEYTHGVKKDPESAWSITAWADSDWKGDTVTGRSTFGWLVQLEGSTVSWRAKRHETVALSTTEAEYTALSQCARELAWTRNLFSELLLPLHMPIPLNGDNQGSLKLCRNPELHQRTKHIPLTEHHIREEVEAGNIDVQYVSTYEQVADGLTKPLNTVSHGHFLEAIRVSACPIEEAGRIIWSTEVHDDSVP
ncbi:hypothetical protein V3481_007371 [Fusarium oxysporum f. sp. vasinfectum]